MGDIYKCVNAFSELLNVEYEFVLGRKGVSVSIKVGFDKKDCYHLMGLQYLTDRPELRRDRGKIFDAILSHEIDKQRVESSTFYNMINGRTNFLPYLEVIMDSNDTIFKYNAKMNNFSMIQADYILKNVIAKQGLFLFLSKNKEDKYFCRSFFPQDKVDYTHNQALWKLLHKKKINLSNNTEIVLYDRLNK